MTVKILLTIAEKDPLLEWLDTRISRENIWKYRGSSNRQNVILEYMSMIVRAVDPVTGAWNWKPGDRESIISRIWEFDDSSMALLGRLLDSLGTLDLENFLSILENQSSKEGSKK